MTVQFQHIVIGSPMRNKYIRLLTSAILLQSDKSRASKLCAKIKGVVKYRESYIHCSGTGINNKRATIVMLCKGLSIRMINPALDQLFRSAIVLCRRDEPQIHLCLMPRMHYDYWWLCTRNGVSLAINCIIENCPWYHRRAGCIYIFVLCIISAVLMLQGYG